MEVFVEKSTFEYTLSPKISVCHPAVHRNSSVDCVCVCVFFAVAYNVRGAKVGFRIKYSDLVEIE